MKMKRQKNYDELTIKDEFMFGKICSKPQNRKLILDSLLQIDLHEKEGDIEKQIRVYKDSKYARLDLVSKDENDRIYNAEMQNKSKNPERQKELPKRSRYYQALIDTDYFKAGKTYLHMPEIYIIFICTFDPFERGLPIYTLETKCNEVNLTDYDDGVHKIFFNTTADLSELPQSIRNMLQYIETGVASDNATKAIDEEVTEARIKEEWREEYMRTLTYHDEIYAEAHEEGYADGQSQGLADGLAQGLAEGLAEGREHLLIDLVKDGLLTVTEAASRAGVTESEFYEKLNAVELA